MRRAGVLAAQKAATPLALARPLRSTAAAAGLATMRAVQVKQHGGAEKLSLETVAKPKPQKREALVQIAFGGINFIDTYQRSGLYPMSLPFTLGKEGAGVVTEGTPRSLLVCLGSFPCLFACSWA